MNAAQEVIARALALSEAATEGPWEHVGRNWIETPPIEVDEANWGPEGHHGYTIHTTQDTGAWRVADAEFIAAARTLLPALAKALGDVLKAAERWDHTAAGDHIRAAITAALSEVTP